MYDSRLHQNLITLLKNRGIGNSEKDTYFSARFISNISAIESLFKEIYGYRSDYPSYFGELLELIIRAYSSRPERMKALDLLKEKENGWFLSQEIVGMSLYVDRFAGNIQGLKDKLSYFEDLGVNLLHLMPLFESPEGESDGGYAVSNFTKVDSRFGSLDDLRVLQEEMARKNQYLMLDIVLNHTSREHEWAKKAKSGDSHYQDYYYMYPDRQIPDQFDGTMPEIFPESAPGNFTYVENCGKWVMSVFHEYQWDLNYTNPKVFLEMLEIIYFYANLGVDLLRIDAPAFIWKQLGTACQNLPMAHTLLRLIKLSVQTASPGMALLGEAIVAPTAIIKYFGTDQFTARECDLAYNATQMAVQWDALATGKAQILYFAQNDILQKPYGCTWINYTRCHDDIGLAYDDEYVRMAGFNPWEHKNYIKNYYTGYQPGSDASGALFSFNPKNQDSRLSGSLASLCGLERSLEKGDPIKIYTSIHKILLMQAGSLFLGGIPMLYYGDELGYTNDYSYLSDPGKSYDNRWMHRPVINWEKNRKKEEPGTVEEIIFSSTHKMIQIRKKFKAFGDYNNTRWIYPYNHFIAGFVRAYEQDKFYCLFNYNSTDAYLTWFAFKEDGDSPAILYDLWEEKTYHPGLDHEYLVLKPYSFMILKSEKV